MKFDYFFATQYKQSFVYFGSEAGTTVAHKDGDICTMNGCIATLVEGVNKEDSYVWSPMPQLSLRLSVNDKVNGSVKLCGGFAPGDDEQIKMFGEINKPEYSNQMLSSKGYYMSKVIPQSWTTSLTMPSQCSQWVEDAPNSQRLNLLSIQKYHHYIFRFYLYNNFTITDESSGVSCSFSTGPIHMNRHVKCALLDDDLFVVCGDKMAKLEKFTRFLSSSHTTPEIEFSYDVPHVNSTPFVIQGILFVVGGCDQDYEPFSDIYQFDHNTWHLCGLSTVSRYGVSVVVFTDRNHCEAIFIAGGFKGDSIPCSVIEKVSVVY